MREPTTSLIPSADGVNVAVHDYGVANDSGGDGHLTFFVHGTGLVSRMWEPVMDLLGPEFRPVGVDLRGHGASTYPDDIEFHDYRMYGDLCAALDHFEAEDAWIVAHSMGAATSILSTLERPGALSRVWAYEPIIYQREAHRQPHMVDFIEGVKKRRAVFGSRAEVIERYGSRPPFAELDPQCLRTFVDHAFVDQPDGTIELACDPILESRAFENYLQDGWERLPDVTVPVRVGYGKASESQMADRWPAIVDRIPHGDADPFEGSDHMGCFGPLDRAATSIADWFLADP